MRVYQGLPKRSPAAKPLALAIGVFDGVHLGHQAILKAAIQQARRLRGTAAALTFDGPPERLLAPDYSPPLLASQGEKLERLAALGMDEAYVVRFTRSFAAQAAEDFVRRSLSDRLKAKAVLVGPDFVFGRQARGDFALLKSLGAELGFEARAVRPVMLGGRPVSSTRIRSAVQDGRMAEAARLLGRPWSLRGRVIHGRRLGRGLGFPTANLASTQEVLPMPGVWAGKVRVRGSRPGAWARFAANLGTRPTFAGKRLSVELHLLGFRGSLYGQELEAEFMSYLRPEKRFSSPQALAAQIKEDVAKARKIRLA
jgi:riboflavin kinase/FMN adenylyltransferase